VSFVEQGAQSVVVGCDSHLAWLAQAYASAGLVVELRAADHPFAVSLGLGGGCE
jgi:hypothetical protein